MISQPLRLAGEREGGGTGRPAPGVFNCGLVSGMLCERQLHDLVGADCRLAVDGGDHVTGGEPRLLSWATGVDAGDQEALGGAADLRQFDASGVAWMPA